MKVVSLHVENVKKIKAVDITPTDNMVVISGRNAQGKTSILDAIWLALAGGAASKNILEPIRNGEESATVTVDLGKYIVTRSWTQKGSYLKVESRDGARYPSPQALLDSLIGEYTFDCLEFSRMKPADQRATLLTISGLEQVLLDFENEYDRLYLDRAVANKELKSLEGKLNSIPIQPEDTPSEFTSIEELVIQQKEARVALADLEGLKSELNQRQQGLAYDEGHLQELVVEREKIPEVFSEAHLKFKREVDQKLIEIERNYQETIKTALKIKEEAVAKTVTEIGNHLAINGMREKCQKEESDQAIAATEEEIKVNSEKIVTLMGLINSTPIPDPESFQTQIVDAQKINVAVSFRKDRERLRDEIAQKSKESAALSEVMDSLKKAQATKIKESPLPIAGLGFADSGVTFNDVPFSQCSSAEQLRVSLAIAMALNPTIKVLRITDGSLLDSDNLAIINDMLKNNDYQLWLETVSESGKVGIYIEDGGIKNIDGNPFNKDKESSQPG